MQIVSMPSQAQQALLQDALQRDRITARRVCLMNLLWQERFLTREQLIARVEGELGKGCFGKAAWQDNFYRDLRFVKQAFRSSGFQLSYGRGSGKTGYYFTGQPDIGMELAKTLDGSIAEIDPRQIAIFRRLAPAQRFRQGCEISDAARIAVTYRIQQRNRALSLAEASRMAVQSLEPR